MLGSVIIVFRETLEAALIVGIIAAATRNVLSRNIWLLAGVGAGITGSVIVAVLTGRIAELAAGVGQEIFNASVLGLAAAMLAWHNIWMARHGPQLAKHAKMAGQAVVSGNREMSALGIVVALAIVREGSETALFLYGVLAGGDDTVATVFGGGVIGLLAGAFAGYGLYAGFLRIPARLLFAVTSGLILLLAAAMSSQMAKFLVQADVLPSLANPLWDTSWLLTNSSLPGRVFHTLMGYEAMPSGIQVVVYTITLLLILAGMYLFRLRPSTRPQT